MPNTTSSLQLPYPSASDAPDGPGAFYALANAIDTKLFFDQLGNYLDFNYVSTTYDNAAGENSMFMFGGLRVVHFAFYRASGWDTVSPPATMRAGHRPTATVWTGASIYDGTTQSAGVASMDTNGAILVPDWVPDVSTDSRYNGVRGTFVYWASH